MKILLLILILFCSLFLFGCTTNTPGTPYTTSQLINRSTDLNYTSFLNGDYNGLCLRVDNNVLTAGSCGDSNSVIDLNDYVPYTGADNDVDLGVYNLDTNFVYANVVWTDQNRGYGIMYCIDGNIVLGFIEGFSC